MSHPTQQSVLLPDVFQKPVVAVFDGATQSTDAGLLILGAIDRKHGLTDAICAPLRDPRQGGKVAHSLHDLFAQRVYSIAAGYPDGNDAHGLRHDPILKMLCDRDPESGDALASQPTISRFERSLSGRDVITAHRAFENKQVERFAQLHPQARRVIIDLDATEDCVHGQQAFAFFNGFYDGYCFLPLLGFLSVEGQPEQHILSARLRPGTGATHRGILPLLRRTVSQLRERIPNVQILVRLDAGFVTPRLLEILEQLRVKYILGLPSNSVLTRKATPYLRGLKTQLKRTKVAARRYGSFSYRARTWSRERRVVVKAEVLPPPARSPKSERKTNLRYVVTNMKTTVRHVYEDLYCMRGDSENRIKELKNDLAMDRTSCSSYVGNQLRVLMTSVAYVLFQEMRRELGASELARAQVHTLRSRIVKVSARVVRSVRRIVLHLPRSCPNATTWCALARRLALRPSG